MKTIAFIWVCFLPLTLFSQFKAGENVSVNQEQDDDVYLAGETININAPVQGDLIAAGNELRIRDSIMQDALVAGGEIWLSGIVNDDVRTAAGKITIDAEIGDDLVIFGGDVLITKNAVIKGNLIVFAGEIDIEGDVIGDSRITAGSIRVNGSLGGEAILRTDDLWFDGIIEGESILTADSFQIGNNAKFLDDVRYWTEDGEIDFGESLENARAEYDEGLQSEEHDFPIEFIGVASFGFWLFYILSAFLAIILLNFGFRKLFSESAGQLKDNPSKSLGYGLIFLFGIPLIVGLSFLIIIGIPLGLMLLCLYIFSLLFGHLVGSLMAAHYLNNRNHNSWNFWTLSILALGIAVIIRLVTFLPILGLIISIFIIAASYGALILSLLQRRAGDEIATSV